MKIRLLLAGLFALPFIACDDESNSNEDPIQIPDATPDPEPDPDAAPEPEPDAAVEADMMEPDAGPEFPGGPVIDAPEALIYLNDPTTDEGMLTRVVLDPVISDDGRLTSEWVEVFNCLNEDGGVSAMPMGLPFTVSLCREVQVARPGDDGHYTHIAPPADDADPNDSFAELMMYHHVNRVHDYFTDTFGFTDLDFPLPALVNVQFKIDPPLPIPGLEANEDGFVPFSNAAFFPKESWEIFAQQFGLPPRDSDSIIFFQGDLDFAYDGRVIYHEYTHAVIGTGRLQAPAVPDEYGLTNSAPSMNEGLADYFAASLADDSVIGAYVGALIQSGALRDLADVRRCPEDTIDEIHAHGQLIGSTMWSVREALGAEVTDEIMFRALEQFTPQTTHAEAAALILAEAEEIGGDVPATVQTVFADHGFGECERSTPLVNFNASTSRDRIPHNVEGQSSLGFGGYRDLGVPAFKQFHLAGDDLEGVAAVQISWAMQSGGGGFLGGGGGADPVLEMLARKGQPILFDYSDGVSADFDTRLSPPASDEGQQTVVLAGDCLPGPGEKLHTLWVNRGNDQVQITGIQVQNLDAVPEDGPVETCDGMGVASPSSPPSEGAGGRSYSAGALRFSGSASSPSARMISPRLSTVSVTRSGFPSASTSSSTTLPEPSSTTV